MKYDNFILKQTFKMSFPVLLLIVLLLPGSVFASAKSPKLPYPPQKYHIPAKPVFVSTTSEFIAAFTSITESDIVLRNGDYENKKYVTAGSCHRIWAENLGKAILKFGIEFSGNSGKSGGEVHGIRFDVDSANQTSSGSIIRTSGICGENVVIMDCWFYGNHGVRSGVYARAASGFVIKRCIVNGFKDYGIAFMGTSPDYNVYSPAIPPVIEDLDISSVYNEPKLSSNGTAEAGLWAGCKCFVSRIRITDISWMGLWTGANCNDAIFRDLTIDNISPQGTGIYVEHYTRRCLFEHFMIGPAKGFPWISGHYMKNGVNTEWDDPKASANPEGDTRGGSHSNTFKDGTINSSVLGFSQEDSENTVISGVTFINQSAAAIKEFRTYDKNYNTVWKDQSDDLSGILSTAVEYTQDHGPLGFSLQPVSVRVNNGTLVKFNALALGSKSFTYQWQKNKTDIPGATSSTYSFIAIADDNKSKYGVIATSTAGKISSVEAILTIGDK